MNQDPGFCHAYSWLRSLGLVTALLVCPRTAGIKLPILAQWRDGQGYLYHRQTKLPITALMATVNTNIQSFNAKLWHHINAPCVISFYPSVQKARNPDSAWNFQMLTWILVVLNCLQTPQAAQQLRLNHHYVSVPRHKFFISIHIWIVLPGNENIKNFKNKI